ncbi:urease accessory protein [Methylopila capsulata]|uniref:Urease accessory protein n=1 Tax=Methylopila capsulata TaxID=61654 RepID=A0A9W6MS96_9HYPH|nr:HupE/UreJ family protein [Methylopila capsulata]MBM7852350.1 urease accessory protein [Methylopila capsulata]GLK56560.1 urease accessory protein [Methylopila capsulata]
MKKALLGAALALAPTAALAHPAAFNHVHGFSEGLAHPLGGADHVLAMVAVGLLAARFKGPAAWAIPLSFMGAMLVGGVVGAAGVAVPATEIGIAFSVLALGLGVGFADRLSAPAAMALAGVFALFHGVAHGAEAPETASGLLYGLGFVAATGALHLAGFGLGRAIAHVGATGGGAVFRIAGAGFAAAGAALLAGVV